LRTVKVLKLFLFATILLTMCEVTGITFLAKTDKVFCYAAGGFETPAEEDEAREEFEDTDDYFFESNLPLPSLTSIDPTFSCSADINLQQPFREIVVPPPQR
jgi:hypothetical protein